MTDAAFMRQAVGLARRGLGETWPNPAVGCVIVRDGLVVGRGWTQRGGRPHAETEALARAGAAARGATAYVTLEPCSHHGRTPPCAEALIAAGVARCVVGIEDPYEQVAGRGIARLREAGVAVELGVLAAECRRATAPFLTRIERGRPLVTLKLATTLDGRIAAANGDSRWITGPLARERAHVLRAEHDAVLVAAGTALADDPKLTCRLPGFDGPERVRVVIDGRLRIGPQSRLARTSGFAPFWVVTRPDAPAAAKAALAAAGAAIIEAAPEFDTHVNLATALAALGARGLTSVLVEGGGSLAGALWSAGLVDRIAWFTAPALMGADGQAAVGELGVTAVDALARWNRVAGWTLGPDRLDIFEP